MFVPMDIEKVFERNSTRVHGRNCWQSKNRRKPPFLNSTANIVRLEILEAFLLKSETRQIYSSHYCSKLHWNKKPEISILKINKRYEYLK